MRESENIRIIQSRYNRCIEIICVLTVVITQDKRNFGAIYVHLIGEGVSGVALFGPNCASPHQWSQYIWPRSHLLINGHSAPGHVAISSSMVTVHLAI